LANNAAFIVGPREQTRQADLGGRAFLHDYNDDADPTGALLESILTAPMVVTHWINMQYNASVTAPHKFGSGNKVLHNVVGGNIGVLEGAAGDLRTGLSLQSVHDGDQWMHSPLRLSVFVFADADKILAIYHQHEVVRQLVDNEWLYLLRVSDDLTVNRLFKGGWENDQ